MFRRFRAGLMVFGVAFINLSPGQTARKTSPNVLVITIDTLRADHVACYGYSQIHTPNIDAIAQDGTLFTRAFTPVPVTLPSHVAIFTGSYPIFNGVHDFSESRVDPAQPTLASVLKSAGYSTGAVIGAAVLGSRFGLNRGFDLYYDHFDYNRLDESNLYLNERPGNVVVDESLKWLKDNYRRRFFLWVHLYDPHFPYSPPEPYRTDYASHPYDGEIAFADAQIGRLLAFLKDNHLYSNTIIVVTGDHGESLGEHGEKTHSYFIYNATLRVPLIIYSPGTRGAKAVPAIVSTIDIAPTILNSLQINTPLTMQGQSLLPYMRNDTISGTEHSEQSVYSENLLPRIHFGWGELHGLETAQYHFIEAPSPELYDIVKDPGETRNIFGDKKAISQVMQGKLLETITKYSRNARLAPRLPLDMTQLDRLQSLGYAGFAGGSGSIVNGSGLPDPKDRLVVYNLISDAMSESQHGDYPASIDKLDMVIRSEPSSVPAHYLQGLNYYRVKNYTKAIEMFGVVMKLDSGYALAAYNLGLAYERNNQIDEAIVTLRRALELDPTNFAAAFNMGVAYLRKQMVPEATAAFQQSIAITDDYPNSHIGMGQVLLYQGRVDDAMVQFQKAIALDPGSREAHADLARAWSAKGNAAKAEEEMHKANVQH